MPKKILIILSLFSVSFLLFSVTYAQESVTITTYYPSPFGSYRELETQTLFFRETNNGLISFNDVNNDNIYNRRLRITAGESDTQDNDQGASIDLHGNSHANAGRLDLVAGRGSNTLFFTSPAGNSASERMRITSGGNVGIGTTSPGAKLHIAGTVGTDGIKFPDGSLQTRATNIYSDIRNTYIDTTSNVSWTDLASVNLPAGFSGGKAYITFTAPIAKDGAFRVRFTLDGSPLTTTPAVDLDAGQDYLPGAIRGAPITLTYVVSNLAAGAHSIKVQWIGFVSASLPNGGGPEYAIIEAGSARVLTVITGE